MISTVLWRSWNLSARLHPRTWKQLIIFSLLLALSVCLRSIVTLEWTAISVSVYERAKAAFHGGEILCSIFNLYNSYIIILSLVIL